MLNYDTGVVFWSRRYATERFPDDVYSSEAHLFISQQIIGFRRRLLYDLKADPPCQDTTTRRHPTQGVNPHHLWRLSDGHGSNVTGA